jgi:uncharacterized membrane protein HdeD (DUF308 family)
MGALPRNWWLIVLCGGLATRFGLAVLLWRDLTLGPLVIVSGTDVILHGVAAVASALRASSRPTGWGLLTGVLEMIGSARLPRVRAGHWFLVLGGLSSLLLAGLLLAVPDANERPVVAIIGIYALVFGALLGLTGFRVRAAAPAMSMPRGIGSRMRTGR